MLFLAFMYVYIRCVWKNLFTRAAYGFLFLGTGILLLKGNGMAGLGFITLGMLILFVAGFGIPTLSMYSRTLDHIAKYGTVDKKFHKIAFESGYCPFVGYLMGLEDGFMLIEEYGKEKTRAQLNSRTRPNPRQTNAPRS